ncbi:MAG: type II secretion system protein [Acidobacteriota bacterium]
MPRRKHHRESGFTLIELMVVLALFGAMAIVLIPAISNLIFRTKTISAANQAAALLRLARAQAIKRNANVVVKVQALSTSEGQKDELFAFTDVNDDGVWDEPVTDGFDKDGNKIAGSFTLPKGVLLAGPGTNDDGNAAAFSNLQTTNGGLVGIVRFFPSGAVQKIGAIRLRDARDNIVEVRVDPQSTGRVSIRKFEDDPFGSDDLTKYYVQGGVPTIGSDSDHTWNWR